MSPETGRINVGLLEHYKIKESASYRIEAFSFYVEIYEYPMA